MRTRRDDFFPSELYWLDRIGPVSRLVQAHGGVPTDVEDLVTIDPNGAPLYVAFDRLIEQDWGSVVNLAMTYHERVILDARVTLNWPTAAGYAMWKGYWSPYMILNLYDLLMRLAIAGAGRIRLYGEPHPRPKHRKFIPLPWDDVRIVALLIERGGEPGLEYEPGAPRLIGEQWP